MPPSSRILCIWYRRLQVCIKVINERRCQRPEFTYKWQGEKKWWVGGITLTTRSFTKLAISLGSPLFSTDSDFQHMWWKGHMTIDYRGIRKSLSSCECLPAFRAAIGRAVPLWQVINIQIEPAMYGIYTY